MTDDQNERGRAVVYDSGRFRLSEECEGAFEVNTTGTAVAGGKIELQIIIRGSGVPERFACALRKGRSTEVGVNDDAGTVDHRLNSTRAKFLKRRLDKIDNCGELRDLALQTNLRQFLSDDIDNQRSGQIDLSRTGLFAQRIENFVHGRNGAPRPRFYFLMHISFFRRRVMRPMTAAQGVRAFFRARRTFGRADSATQSSRPPLV